MRPFKPQNMSNNAAVAAQAALDQVDRVAIIDWDGFKALSKAVGGVPVYVGSSWLILAVVVIALVLAPLQAIGMELSMRAVPMQAVGSRWRSPLLAIAAATLLALVARPEDES
mgnify:CR=1 FL=1